MHYVIVMLLVFVVNFLLAIGTRKYCGSGVCILRCILAAVAGAVHAVACLIPGWGFLGHGVWYVISILMISWIAFGIRNGVIVQYAVFFMLRLAVGGLSRIGGTDVLSVTAGIVGLCFVLILGFLRITAANRLVQVELKYGKRVVQILALRDTGNTLRDPVTGEPVLVVDAKAAQALTGLPKELLADPVEALRRQALPGLRLIPYRCVNSSGAMLLGLRISHVKIGAICGSRIVAFAPVCFETEEGYQALTGGMQ